MIKSSSDISEKYASINEFLLIKFNTNETCNSSFYHFLKNTEDRTAARWNSSAGLFINLVKTCEIRFVANVQIKTRALHLSVKKC